MAPIETLPTELVVFIADLSAQRPRSNFNRNGEINLRHFSAFARTSRRFYATLNALLYSHNFKHQPPVKSCVLWAVKHGRLDTLKRARFYGADLSAYVDARPGRGTFRSTPLHLAIQLNHLDIFNYLLDEGVELESFSEHMCSCNVNDDAFMFPLHTAIVHSRNPQYAKTLIEKGCYRASEHSPAIELIEDSDTYADSVATLIERSEPYALAASFHHAVRKNKPDLARDLLERRGADVTYRFHTRGTALHFALIHYQDDLEIFKLLLDHPGIDLSAGNNGHGMTPLSYCATRPELLEAAKLLVAHPDIQISAPNSAGSTPLHLAAASGSVSMFNLLAHQPGIDFGATDVEGCTVFHLALESMPMDIDIARFLLQQPGISPSAATQDGVTPLHRCALRPSLIEIARLLLSYPDVQPHASDWTGATPLLYAAKSHSMDMFRLLFHQPGLQVNAEDAYGDTALHFCAASESMLEATELLLGHTDIDVHVLGTTDESPIECAATSGSFAMFELFANHPAIDLGCNAPGVLDVVCCGEETEDTKAIVSFILDYAHDYGLDNPAYPGSSVHDALAWKNFDTALLLLSGGALPARSSVAMGKGWSELHYSLMDPHPLQTELVKALLAAGVDADCASGEPPGYPIGTNSFSSDGTPLFFALAGAKNVECMEMLLEAGADPNALVTSLEAAHGTARNDKQSMIAALCRHVWKKTCRSGHITEESINSVKEGIVLLLKHGSSIGGVGKGVSALRFAAEAAHYGHQRSLLNLFLEHATCQNIQSDDVAKTIDRLGITKGKEEAETVIALLKFQERLLTENGVEQSANEVLKK